MMTNREHVSLLMDGRMEASMRDLQTQADEASDLLSCWHVYHLIGDALRSDDLLVYDRGPAFAAQLREKMAARPAVDELVPQMAAMQATRPPRRKAANDSVFRWKMVAGFASISAVTLIGWSLFSSLHGADSGAAVLAESSSNHAVLAQTSTQDILPDSNRDSGDDALLIWRDPELDELLSAHRQAAGVSTFGGGSGFLRNATFQESGW